MRAAISLIVALALLLTACTGPGAQPTPTPADSSKTTPVGDIDACSVLTDAEIEAATGQRVAERRLSALRPDVFPSICDIELDGGGSLTVSMRTTGGRSMYEDSFEAFIGEQSYLDEAVAGLGDKAGRAGDDTLMVLQGDVLFEVQYLEFGSSDELARVRYLAEVILAKLPCIAAGCPGFTPPPPPASAPVVDACALLAVDEIEAATGYPTLDGEPSIGLSGAARCRWTVDADPQLPGLYWIELELLASGGREQFDFWAQAFDPPLEHVPGLGEDAIQTGTIPGGQTYVVVGDRLITLSFAMPLSVDDPYSLVRPLLDIALGRISRRSGA